VRRATLYVAAAAAGAGAWWLFGQREAGGVVGDLSQGLNDALNAIVKGSRLTRASYDKTTGVVPGTPEELADLAGLDVEAYSLARLIASEEGRSSNSVKAAVAWAVLNHATNSGKSVTALLTHAKLAAHSGSYGTQRNIEEGTPGYNGSDRYASTAADPYEGDGAIAAAVIAGQLADPTNGAEYFDRPAGESDPDKIAANRAASGLVLADVFGVDADADGIRFWRAA
jgi:hypothetical protein